MRSSRQQFNEYRDHARERDSGGPQSGASHPVGVRHRTFWELFSTFLDLLKGQRGAVTFALASLTVATLVKLVPPISIKIAIDYVLAEQPLPNDWMQRWSLPTDPAQLLFLLAFGVVLTSLFASAIHLWGRWYATKTVNRVQVLLRKRVFEHAVRLPLHRVYEIKTGGATSLLREDAGGRCRVDLQHALQPLASDRPVYR